MATGINQIRAELRAAYASGDADAVKRAKEAQAAWCAAHPPKKSKGRSAGQARYVATLKRHGWL